MLTFGENFIDFSLDIVSYLIEQENSTIRLSLDIRAQSKQEKIRLIRQSSGNIKKTQRFLHCLPIIIFYDLHLALKK